MLASSILLFTSAGLSYLIQFASLIPSLLSYCYLHSALSAANSPIFLNAQLSLEPCLDWLGGTAVF
jgi:hypothetical protein